MLKRDVYEEEHELFRETVRRFFEEEVMPRHDDWEERGHVDREVWRKAGEMGLLCATMPEAYGGSGVDRRTSAVLIEEQHRFGASGIGFSLHSDIAAPYIAHYGSEEQKQRYLPAMARGEIIGAIAMTEPGTGSDLQAITTRAEEDGDHFVLNGAKTYITNGYLCDFAIVVAKTSRGGGAKGMSLLLVDADSEGFHKDKPFKKLGLRAQDTCQLTFDDVRVPKENLLGMENGAFPMLMNELAWERLIIAIGCAASMTEAFRLAKEYTQGRTAFGKPIAAFQDARFKLADLKTKAQIAQVFVDKCIEEEVAGRLQPDTAAMAKAWTSETLSEVADTALQLHGGYGFMWEAPIARLFADARVQRIYGGSTEIMKEIVARNL
ncbi:acyl-CoA dehydrogenase family protein [Parvularcula maris]|uniref:Acyl-[acyl-carrier-protein] dehydrogenase MbtN n=1 Tax=Parvularcula maris TaxID=2965077 RepID=A0A9X2RHW7_9PROT|nr:acyl-CoA dehydrogenase family protein [Parvularcula maris]MCQ8185385.1 acyl-CoA dehydrogenase family protein [Parvularcula maris]